MGNHKRKKVRALEHNRIYAINRGETAIPNEPKRALKKFEKKARSKPERFDGSLHHVCLVFLCFSIFYWGTTWLIQY